MKSVSLDIGSVRLTERILKHDPPTGEELEQAVRLVKRELGRLTDFPFSGTTLVGVAGTATSLAVLAQGLRAFELSAVTNYRLERTVVESLFQKLSRLPAAEIREMSSIMEGRADVITAGVLILREVMRYCAAGDIIVSERGVRYGLALREWEATSRAG
jgi:exopolyphosphatase/guanosine-5'-triphosphate,3'-diphosphate pyrophosphatase